MLSLQMPSSARRERGINPALPGGGAQYVRQCLFEFCRQMMYKGGAGQSLRSTINNSSVRGVCNAMQFPPALNLKFTVSH